MSEEIPFVAIDPGKEDEFMLHDTCKKCGGEIEFSFAELLRCGRDDDRPRPTCKQCGRPVKIRHARILRDGEWVDE